MWPVHDVPPPSSKWGRFNRWRARSTWGTALEVAVVLIVATLFFVFVVPWLAGNGLTGLSDN